jgi:hypothetical protein
MVPIVPSKATPARRRIAMSCGYAAAGQLLFIAFEDAGVPAGAAKKMRGEEPAQRSADYQRARRILVHGIAQDRLSCPGL